MHQPGPTHRLELRKVSLDFFEREYPMQRISFSSTEAGKEHQLERYGIRGCCYHEDNVRDRLLNAAPQYLYICRFSGFVRYDYHPFCLQSH